MAELRIGVIGVGAMGTHHVRVYGELDGARVVAVADASAERLAELAAGDVRGYRDYRALLAEESLDAVSVVVPARLHREVAVACLERGIPTLVEKPLAADSAECDAIRSAARATDAPLMVGHVERFNPAVVELRRRLDEGALGRLYQLRARRVGPFFARERDVGVVHDLATHDIDCFRALLGCEVEIVQAETERGLRTEQEDALVGLLRFENGAVATLETNWLSPRKERELTVLGERGMLTVDYLAQELRSLFLGAGEPAGETPALDVARFPDAGQAPLRAELAAFLRVARGEEAPAVSVEDGAAAVRVADALVESGRTGEAVRLLSGGVAS